MNATLTPLPVETTVGDYFVAALRIHQTPCGVMPETKIT